MDWPRDSALLGEDGLYRRRVFTYGSRPATVIKILENNRFDAQIWTLEGDKEWSSWLDQIDAESSGLILILSNRETAKADWRRHDQPTSIDGWFAQRESSAVISPTIRRAETFAALGEQKSLNSNDAAGKMKPSRRGVRCLPFSEQTFRRICYHFEVHQSIVRALTRGDVPSFSCSNVHMKSPAFVYNCRTSNSWESDIAFSATYYPKGRLNLGIFYGTSPKIENDIMERLQSIREEAAHPLLPLGILAEIELRRHTRLVDKNINVMEAKILELNILSGRKTKNYDREEIERKNEAKREAWLNLSYLRNSLVTWDTQLQKMAGHAQLLGENVFQPISNDNILPQDNEKSFQADTPQEGQLQDHDLVLSHNEVYYDCANIIKEEKLDDSKECPGSQSHGLQYPGLGQLPTSINTITSTRYAPLSTEKRLHDVSILIESRLEDMREEYQEKIRDCTMRVDGMAMATQWIHSETAVEIALATNRDSKVMRSISLVTMIFLPGTFFATIFSMTFFDWSGTDGKTKVSGYLWIYVVVTVVFTAITLGLWYFFVIFRRPTRKDLDSESMMME